MSLVLTYEFFAGLDGKEMQLAVNENEQINITLKEVNMRPNPPEGWENFILLFEGPAQPVLTQGTYEITSGEDSFPLFLVPVEGDHTGVAYEVVFNRKLPEAG